MAIMEMIDKIEGGSSIEIAPSSIIAPFEVMHYYAPEQVNIETDYNLNGLDPDIINLTSISATYDINDVSMQLPYADSSRFVLVTRENITVEYGSFIVIAVETSTKEKGRMKVSRYSGSVGSITRKRNRNDVGICIDRNIDLAETVHAYLIGNANKERKEYLKWTKYKLKGSTKRFYFNVMKIGMLDKSINSGSVDCARIFLSEGTKVSTKWYSRKYLDNKLKHPETSYAMRMPHTGEFIELEPIRCGKLHSNYARCFRVAEWSQKLSDKLDKTCSGARIHNGKSEPGLMLAASKVMNDKRYIFAVNSSACLFESPYSYFNSEYHYKFSVWEWFGYKQEL